nr:helix-turn-helix domain-containing protein [Novosphingobium aerophilum]
MAQAFGVGLAVKPSDGCPFEAHIDGYVGQRLRFASLHFSAHATSSSRWAPHDRRMLVSVHQEGPITIQQDGRKCRVDPGQMFMLDPSRPFHLETGTIHSSAVFVNSAMLRSIIPEADMMTARAIQTDVGAGAIFRNFLLDLIARKDGLQEEEANQLAGALPHLISASLASSVDPSHQTTRLRHFRKKRILAAIEDRLPDPRLSAAEIAAAVGLSLRYVHDLFSESGDSLMSYVWRARVERACDELVSHSAMRRSIGEIAYGWGFNHVSHFSRAFRDRYGVAPREYRQTNARTDQ